RLPLRRHTKIPALTYFLIYSSSPPPHLEVREHLAQAGGREVCHGPASLAPLCGVREAGCKERGELPPTGPYPGRRAAPQSRWANPGRALAGGRVPPPPPAGWGSLLASPHPRFWPAGPGGPCGRFLSPFLLHLLGVPVAPGRPVCCNAGCCCPHPRFCL